MSDEKTKEFQYIIDALVAQRDAALNQVAQLSAANRKLTDEIATLKAPPPGDKADAKKAPVG